MMCTPVCIPAAAPAARSKRMMHFFCFWVWPDRLKRAAVTARFMRPLSLYKMSVTAHFMNPMNLFTTRVGDGEIVAPFFRVCFPLPISLAGS